MGADQVTPEAQTRADRLAARLSGRGGGESEQGERDDEGAEPLPERSEEQVKAPEVPQKDQKDARTKYQAYVRASIKEEAQAAVFWTNNQPGGYASLTELTEAALEREIERLRDRFTHGEPFPPMPKGKRLPTRPPQGR